MCRVVFDVLYVIVIIKPYIALILPIDSVFKRRPKIWVTVTIGNRDSTGLDSGGNTLFKNLIRWQLRTCM